MPHNSRLPLLALFIGAATFAAAPLPPAASAPISLATGWSQLKEGQGDGTIEADAKNAANPNPHLLKISVTNYPDAGKGRFGVKNSTPIAVKNDMSYDIAFNGTSEGIGVGLVVSLETDDGTVLARTTLPEIGRGGAGGGGRGGRGGRGGAASAPATVTATASAPATVAAPGASPWRRYLVSLHARASSPSAHLTITPIETVPVWIEALTVTERPTN